jgi:hypothetical protein
MAPANLGRIVVTETGRLDTMVKQDLAKVISHGSSAK